MARHSTADHSAGQHQSRKKFNPRNPAMEVLLRGLLHELRNPLSSILTAATLLQDSPSPDTFEASEESRMLLDVVKKESLRLNHILTEFAGYIKLAAPQPKTFDLAGAARAVIRELQRDGTLVSPIEIKDELPSICQVWGDEGQIRTALSHILHNAAEAMPEGGALCLSSQDNEGEENVTFCVTDSGKGFTSESRDRAFQPFYSSKEHGIGLGLSSVVSLIEAANGRVWLEENSQLQPPVPPAGSTSGFSIATSSLSICFQLPRAKP